jgi:LPXTG-motif cell wall-anchored protein
MKFNTRSRVGVTAIIAGAAVTIGSLGSGGTASASTCFLNSYTWSGVGKTNLSTGVIIPAPAAGAIFQAIYVTYDATGSGETIKATIGGLQVGGTGGAGNNVFLLDGTATNIVGGEIAMMNATGTPGSLMITSIFVQTNTCIETAPPTTVAPTTVAPTTTPATVAPTTAAPTTVPATVAPTTTPATTVSATTTPATAAPTTVAPATTQAPATTVRPVTTTTQVASGGPTTTAATATTVRGTTATSVASAAVTTVRPSVSPASGGKLPQTGGNLDAIGFLAGAALFGGGVLLIARRRTTNA